RLNGKREGGDVGKKVNHTPSLPPVPGSPSKFPDMPACRADRTGRAVYIPFTNGTLRMAEDKATDRDNRLKRLKFRSWHRGIKEMDLILGHFANETLEALSPGELDQYEALIEIEDTSLYNWITGRE